MRLTDIEFFADLGNRQFFHIILVDISFDLVKKVRLFTGGERRDGIAVFFKGVKNQA